MVWNRFLTTQGRHSHWKVVRGCVTLKTPFQTIFCSTDLPFQALFQLQRPHFCFSKYLCIFKPKFCWFWQNFSSWDTSFSENLFPKICSRDSSLKPKNKFQSPYSWKPGRTYPKILLSYPSSPSPGPQQSNL